MNNKILFLFFFTIAQGLIDPNVAFGKNCTQESSRRICGDQLVCINGICTGCQDNIDCSTTTNIICKNVSNILVPNSITNPNILKICEHKNIFDSINYFDIICIILIFLIANICAISGIGGGGFFVIIIFLLLQFPVEMSARLSRAIIFGMAVGNMINYLPLRHPTQNKPMIDYDTAVLMEIYTLAGTIFGVILNIIFPGWLITLFLVILLMYVGIKVILRYRELDIADKKKKEDSDIDMVDFNSPEFEQDTPEKNFQNYFVLPYNMILILGWIIIVIFSALKGSRYLQSIIGIEYCSSIYWVLNVVGTVVVILIGVFFGIYLYRKYKRKKESGHEFKNGNIKWNKKNSLVLPPILFIGGVIGTILGLGGGIIKTPIMIHLKMLPDVMVATSAYSLLFSSSSSIVQYFLFGVLPLDYTIVFFAIGLIASLIGHLVIGFFIHKNGKPKILLLILGILTFILVGVALGYGIYRIVIDIQDGVDMGFKSIC